jgi:hypothetical protein
MLTSASFLKFLAKKRKSSQTIVKHAKLFSFAYKKLSSASAMTSFSRLSRALAASY